ncbi:unnamed protein product [Allacma fusca]|uniref:Uncharacterized protein n=1 Tax=Allacma fusca TaxID=39272 RepID=A0A8J2JXW8_9HEXA|nr:unnamed protein product [Allacma fusca]
MTKCLAIKAWEGPFQLRSTISAVVDHHSNKLALLQPGSSSEIPDGSQITCEEVTCGHHEECVLQDVFCVKAPCYPMPVCQHRRHG